MCIFAIDDKITLRNNFPGKQLTLVNTLNEDDIWILDLEEFHLQSIQYQYTKEKYYLEMICEENDTVLIQAKPMSPETKRKCRLYLEIGIVNRQFRLLWSQKKLHGTLGTIFCSPVKYQKPHYHSLYSSFTTMKIQDES